MRSFLLVLAVLAAFSTTSALNVTCYYKSKNDYYTPEDIPVNICTHINYVFMGINEDGSLKLNVDDSIIKRLAALKLKNPRLKVLLSIGGSPDDSTIFSNVAADAKKIAQMAESTMWYMKTYNLDGVDVDWNFPAQNGGIPADKANFIDMLKVLRTAFSANGTNLILTIASSFKPSSESYDISAIGHLVDAINVMTYDLHTSDDGKTGLNAPLYAATSDSEAEKKYTNVNASISNWIEAGAKSSQISLGLAFYGHGFQLDNSSNHGIDAPTSGEGAYTSYVHYDEICQLKDGWSEVWDDQHQVPYKYNTKSGDWISYDNPESIALKVQYAKRQNLGGVIVYAVYYDDKNGVCGPKNILMDTIKDNL